MNHKILLVDDEELILKTLKRVLRKEPYEVFTATSGQEGLEIIKEHQISVIVSDMRMPQMNGAEFLKESIQLSPDSIRIILSGYAEKDSILSAINDGSVWTFLVKPWDNEEILLRLKNAIEVYEEKHARQELLNQLESKNKELSEMNTILDKKVEERTYELNSRSMILEKILDTTRIDEVIQCLETELKKIAPIQSAALVDVKSGSSYAIERKGEELGFLSVEWISEPSEKEVELLKRFLPILGIAISMNSLEQNSGEIVKNIDNILDNI